MNVRISKMLATLAPSATLAVAEKAAALRAAGKSVVDFSAGQPDFDTPAHIKAAVGKALEAGDTKYPSPVAGKTPLREAICTYYKQHAGVSYEPAQVVVTVGAKDALHLAFASLLDPGDEVIIPAPYWVSYPEQVRLFGGLPVILQSGVARGGLISAAELRAAITPRTRAFVFSSPSNPSGATYTRGELDALAAVLREHDIIAISDELYHRLVFDGNPSASLAACEGMIDRTLTVNGLSKTYAMTGWRLGFACGPKPLVSAMARLQGQTTTGAASFIQTAAVTALLGDQTCVDAMRAAYRERCEVMYAALQQIAGVRCERPSGAYYCFPDVSGTFERLGVRNADGFAERLLELAHVAVVSGSAFGCDTHIRLSFATGRDVVEEGMSRMVRALK
ncbi:MAG: pyridoxal phosphate-dependent aminotransferase [Planctomycetia bacterium]|nr:MAG: pyridoxal phosphate-dependent aminotransferase [Planctomycetia bacterium]